MPYKNEEYLAAIQALSDFSARTHCTNCGNVGDITWYRRDGKQASKPKTPGTVASWASRLRPYCSGCERVVNPEAKPKAEQKPVTNRKAFNSAQIFKLKACKESNAKLRGKYWSQHYALMAKATANPELDNAWAAQQAEDLVEGFEAHDNWFGTTDDV